ncbi:hypothetical protein LTS18_008666 [Coniosporium uncinatum]|uniref:Uncharacterized protein n=1 Tax=Coniosporium uncinatum TaxID=93489 RepID=A0ACC3DWR3_9PEZI|nr:hypothetical protein LTS18_008666 [Coniosporium uncinatum]
MAIQEKIKSGFGSWTSQIKEDLKVENGRGDDADDRQWSNQDLDSTPPHQRTWQWYNYLLYFVGTGFNNW